jgi:hypothetical protein
LRDKREYNKIQEDIKSKEEEIKEGIGQVGFYSRWIDRNRGGLAAADQIPIPPDAVNDNLPEYGNPAGGMGGQYSAADVDSGKNTNVVDNSSTTNVVNVFFIIFMLV